MYKKTGKNDTKWLWYIHKYCKCCQREDLGDRNIESHEKFTNNSHSGVPDSQDAVKNEADAGVEVSTGTQDKDSDWDIG